MKIGTHEMIEIMQFLGEKSGRGLEKGAEPN